MKKDYLFYMANLAPELGRMQTFYSEGKSDEYARAQSRAEAIVTRALEGDALSTNGRAELSQLRSMIGALGALPVSFMQSLTTYALPFAERFAAGR